MGRGTRRARTTPRTALLSLMCACMCCSEVALGFRAASTHHGVASTASAARRESMTARGRGRGRGGEVGVVAAVWRHGQRRRGPRGAVVVRSVQRTEEEQVAAGAVVEGAGKGAVGAGTGAASAAEPILYQQRWVQLGILAMLALISDMVCFATAAVPSTWEQTFGHNPSNIIDIFLFTNVASCFLVTDVTRKVGLQKAIQGAGALMTAGCFLRSGLPFAGSMPTYAMEVAGTVLVGMAQPFFQCTPPLLSATWFGSDERALATAVAINFNQVGIGSAFIVGGALAHGGTGLHNYFGLISIASLATAAVALLRFEERPPTPPSLSAANKLVGGASTGGEAVGAANGWRDPFFTFPAQAAALFQKPGFLSPLAAFVTSIGVSNVVSAFTENTLNRAGFFDQTGIDFAGAGFQMAIVLGGIVVGGYVDRTKKYKAVTLACLSATLGLLVLLGLAFGFQLDMPHWLVIAALLGLGATAGPIQPINAELAVEVAYPADETNIEAVQQLCGNLFSALLVPLCEAAATFDFNVLPGVGPDEDMRGDSLVLVALTLATFSFFTSFEAALKRTEVDNEGSQE